MLPCTVLLCSENIRGSVESQTGWIGGGGGTDDRKIEKLKRTDWRLESLCQHEGAATRRVPPGKGKSQGTPPPLRSPAPPALFSRWDESVPSWPVNGSIDLYTHAHAGGARWRGAEPKAHLSGWLLLLLLLLLFFYLYLYAFTQHSEICHLQSLFRWPRDNRCLVSFQHQHLAGWQKCPASSAPVAFHCHNHCFYDSREKDES